MERHSVKRAKKGKDARKPPGRPSGAPPARRPAGVVLIVLFVFIYVAVETLRSWRDTGLKPARVLLVWVLGGLGFSPFPESKSLAEYVAQTTEADDRVLVIGSEPQILFYARRRSACSFPIIYPLMASYPRYKEFQERVWEEVRRNRPKVALDVVNIPASLLWDGKADLDIWNRLHGMLRDEYAVERAMLITGARGGWAAADDERLQRTTPVVYIFRRKS